MPDPRPALFVTTEVPPDRVGAFQALAARTPVEFALFGGGLHATAGVRDHGLPAREVSQREIYGLAASGRYGVVLAGTAGRTALPAAWLGAERARVPFVLWSALWAHPRSLAHLPGELLLRLLYRRARTVVTYGPHVSALAQAHGARRTVVAPQAVDVEFWSAQADAEPAQGPARLLFVGRDDPGKGVPLLLDAWRRSTLASEGAELRLVGPGGTDRAADDPPAWCALASSIRLAYAISSATRRVSSFRPSAPQLSANPGVWSSMRRCMPDGWSSGRRRSAPWLGDSSRTRARASSSMPATPPPSPQACAGAWRTRSFGGAWPWPATSARGRTRGMPGPVPSHRRWGVR